MGDHLEKARLELQDALGLALANRDAPGYQLATYQLKLADLLCVMAGNDATSGAWSLGYAGKNTKSAANIQQLLAQVNRDTSRVVESIETLGRTISSLSDEAAKLVKNLEEQSEELYVRLKASPTDRQPVSIDQQHTICFVALPFHDDEKFKYETVLLPALQDVLKGKPYYWQVVRADARYYAVTIDRNIAEWIKRAHVYIADISDLNPNVMMELGYMYWTKKDEQPLIVLEREGVGEPLADLGGFIRIYYKVAQGDNPVEKTARDLKTEFEKKSEEFEKLNAARRAHYLSPKVLIESYIGEIAAKRLAEDCITMERLRNDDVKEILARLRGLDDELLIMPNG